MWLKEHLLSISKVLASIPSLKELFRNILCRETHSLGQVASVPAERLHPQNAYIIPQ